MSMIRTFTTTTSTLARALKLGMIAVAALLVAGSIATSIARPAPKTFAPRTNASDEAALNAVVEPLAEISVWGQSDGAWNRESLLTQSAINSVAPILLRFDGVEAGKTYTLGVRYRSCGAGGAGQFDALTTAPPISGSALREFPGPGRDRPDAMMAIPPEHAVDAGTGARIALWGGTFTSAARGTTGSTSCEADAILELPVRAQANQLVVTIGGQIPAGSAAVAPASSVSGFISPTP